MFEDHIEEQFRNYGDAVRYYAANPECLINIERFVMDEIMHFLNLHIPEIKRDYDEASRLYPFWKNYPPLDRGRAPVGDQYPWIEVGEQVFGNKLSRYFASNFKIRDTGLPSGADDRCIISSERIREILGITDSVWVFIDIKSSGPRDEAEHAVMSPYQISGSGNWEYPEDGVRNDPIMASGKRKTHPFLCSMSPLYVLSDGLLAPLAVFVIKPEYGMLYKDGRNVGQPLRKIKVASVPNGLLLTRNPAYLKQYPHLFFPGKDDRSKDDRKVRARVSFGILEEIDRWRVKEMQVR